MNHQSGSIYEFGSTQVQVTHGVHKINHQSLSSTSFEVHGKKSASASTQCTKSIIKVRLGWGGRQAELHEAETMELV